MDYIISEVYKDLVPPLTPEEYTTLENSIIEKGLYSPIVINPNKVILDGYNRLEICLKHKITPEFLTKRFKSNLDEEIYVVEANLKRRQLNSYQVAEMGNVLHSIEAKYAKKRKMQPLKKNAVPVPTKDKGKTAKKVADKIGLSTTTYEKSRKIMNSDDEALKEKARKGKVTVNKAYSTLMNKEKKENILKDITTHQTSLPKSINLYNKDFRDLKIKDDSVSLIFTDPPYTAKYLPLYSDMGEQAMKVLRPGGSLLCFIGQFAILDAIKRLQDTGLTFQWILAVVHSGSNPVFFKKSIIQSWKPILWFTKGDLKKTKAVKDSIISKPPSKALHNWAQSSEESDYYIEAFTEKNDIVYDPFLGSGVFGLSAKKLERQFIGSEIDAVHFNTAKSIISQKVDG